MSLLPLFVWLSRTSVGIFMQQSTYAFAIVEMVHLLALALLGGTVLIADLSLFGIGFKGPKAAELARELSPWLLGSLALMVISGVLLLSEEALKCYYNPAFRLKMLFLFLAVLFYFTIHRRARSKVTAGVSLALWLSVGLAGRAIGFI
jgi:hypothetical protein